MAGTSPSEERGTVAKGTGIGAGSAAWLMVLPIVVAAVVEVKAGGGVLRTVLTSVVAVVVEAVAALKRLLLAIHA